MGLLIVLYIYFSIPAFQHVSENTYQPEVCQDGWHPHISFTAWAYPWMGRLYIILCLLSMLIVSPKTPYISFYLFATLLLSVSLYNRSFASLWCWFAVLSPVVFTTTCSITSTRFNWLFTN